MTPQPTRLATAFALGATLLAACVEDDGLDGDALDTAAVPLTVGAIERLTGPELAPPGASTTTGHTWYKAISRDGTIVAFASRRGTPGFELYVRDRAAGTTTRLTTGWDLTAMAMSGDGRWIAATTRATAARAAGVHLLDRSTGTWTTVYAGTPSRDQLALTDDGAEVVFATLDALDPTDANEIADLYVWTRATGGYERVTRNPDGSPFRVARITDGPFLTPDGRHLVWSAEQLAGTWRGTYLLDRATSTLERHPVKPDGSPGSQYANFGGMTPDGRFLMFGEDGLEIVIDRVTRARQFVERSDTGEPADRGGIGGSLSDDGRFVALSSTATNLDGDDINETTDVYVRDRYLSRTRRISTPVTGLNTNGPSYGPVVAGGGAAVAFTSTATDLVVGAPTDRAQDLYVRPIAAPALPGPLVHVNRYAYTRAESSYQHAGPVTVNDTVATRAGARIQSLAGSLAFLGADGDVATLALDVRWTGARYEGSALIVDPGSTSLGATATDTTGFDPARTVVDLTELAGDELLLSFHVPDANPVNVRGLRLAFTPGRYAEDDAGWAYANRPTTWSYLAAAGNSFSSTGEPIRVTRGARGRYQVRFEGRAPAAGAVVQVVANGTTSASCAYAGQAVDGRDLVFDVACTTHAGLPVDVAFQLAWVRDTEVTGAPGLVTISYDGSTATVHNSSGGSHEVARSSRGVYKMAWDGQTYVQSNVMVTARSTTGARCKIQLWGGAGGTVLCHAPDGTLVDSGWELWFVAARTAWGGVGAHLWANDAYSPPWYTPSSLYAFSPGSAPRAGWSASIYGYTVHFPGLAVSQAAALATAYGNDATWCHPEKPASAGYPYTTIACFRPGGTRTQTRYTAAHWGL